MYNRYKSLIFLSKTVCIGEIKEAMQYDNKTLLKFDIFLVLLLTHNIRTFSKFCA